MELSPSVSDRCTSQSCKVTHRGGSPGIRRSGPRCGVRPGETCPQAVYYRGRDAWGPEGPSKDGARASGTKTEAAKACCGSTSACFSLEQLECDDSKKTEGWKVPCRPRWAVRHTLHSARAAGGSLDQSWRKPKARQGLQGPSRGSRKLLARGDVTEQVNGVSDSRKNTDWVLPAIFTTPCRLS